MFHNNILIRNALIHNIRLNTDVHLLLVGLGGHFKVTHMCYKPFSCYILDVTRGLNVKSRKTYAITFITFTSHLNVALANQYKSH